MNGLRISRKAENDLVAIAHYGIENFGIIRSNAYRDRIIRRLMTIAERPERYPRVDHIRKGYRRSVIGTHSIYYKIDGNIVYIVRILSRQDLTALTPD